MQYYVEFEDGNIKAFYVDTIHENITEAAIPISVEEWQLYAANANGYKLDNGVIREKTQQEIEIENEAKKIVSPSIEQRLLATEQALLNIMEAFG